MKKTKIIGLSVALLGVLASAGTAIALYSNDPGELGVNIAAGTIEVVTTNDSITYKSGSVDVKYLLKSDGSETEATNLDGTHDAIRYKVPLSATYPSSGIFAQDSIIGNAKVTVTPNANIPSTVSFEMYAGMKNYAETNYYNQDGGAASKLTTDGNAVFTNAAKTSGSGTFSAGALVVSRDVPAKTTSGAPTLSDNYLEIWIKVTGYDSAAVALAADESLFNIKVEWGSAVSGDYAYVVGYATDWKAYKEYRMMPSLDAADTTFKWKMSNCTLAGDVKIAKIPAANFTDGGAVPAEATWCAGENFQMNGNTTIKWDESAAPVLSA